ncbi:MAG: hypothetical protein LUE86_13250 [Clostridiales bacterium]|nr:hypothetical protein [Clostridiales bacterium]
MKKKIEPGMAICCDTPEEAVELLKQLRDMGYLVRLSLDCVFSKDRAYVIPVGTCKGKRILYLELEYLLKKRKNIYSIVKFSDLRDDVSGCGSQEMSTSQINIPTVTDTVTLDQAIKKYGEDAQVDIAIEEMSELTKALLKYRRARKKPTGNLSLELANIHEETADVIIMMYQMLMIYGGEDVVQEIISQKIKRLAKRLDANGRKEKSMGTQKIGLVLKRDVQTGENEFTPVYKTLYVEIPNDGNCWQVVGQTEDTFFDKKAKLDEYREVKSIDTHPIDDHIRYWSSCKGELYHPDNMPMELRKAYQNLWTDQAGSYCYLVEYDGQYGIALRTPFTDDNLDDLITDGIETDSMDQIYEYVRYRARELCNNPVFAETTVIVAEYSLDYGHELFVFLPWNTTKEQFNEIAGCLRESVYDMRNYLKKRMSERRIYI